MKKTVTIKFLTLLLILGLCLSLAACQGGTAGTAENSGAGQPADNQAKQEDSAGKKQFISIATASLGGSYYPIGVGMAEIFQKNLNNVEASVEVTGGATENPKLVGAGDSDIGFTNANLAYAAYSGTGIFEGSAYGDLRLMFGGVAPGTIHMVVKADSDIQTYADLKGRKVAVGPQGGGGLSLLPDLFKIYDMTMDDIKASYMSYDEGVQAVIDGHVEAAFAQAPHPASAIKNIQGSGVAFRLIEMTEEERTQLLTDCPYYNSVDIPADVYGTDHDIKTIGSSNVVVINAGLSEDLVYQMVKAVYENLDALHDVHPSASSIALESAVNKMIPMHEGAIKYFTEMGVY
ncbi:MAG: TAXI family TRAP transporter solute-binding subunit [Peptococcaceae bacterium]|nr:TAXI family TRAP transporter solute-binding subunit [Peptococcaceae bacterium]